MYGSTSYTGLTRRNTLFVFLWRRHTNTWIPIQHVGSYMYKCIRTKKYTSGRSYWEWGVRCRARWTPRPCSVCGARRLSRRGDRRLVGARFGRWREKTFGRARCLTLRYSLPLSVWVDPLAEHTLSIEPTHHQRSRQIDQPFISTPEGIRDWSSNRRYRCSWL